MNSKKLLTLTALSAIGATSIFAAGCGEEDGSGKYTTITVQNMENKDITKVTIHEAFDVEITVDANAPEMAQLTIDDNLAGDLLVRTDNDEFSIGFDDLGEDKNPTRRPTLKLSLHDLEKVRATDDANITVTGIDAGHFKVDQGGKGRIEVSGIADELTVSATDSGEVDARGLTARIVELDNTAEGDIKVTATAGITGDIEDDGDVLVYGSPASQDVKARAGGRLLMQ